MIIKNQCPTCNKQVEVIEQRKILNHILIKYSCKHEILGDLLLQASREDVISNLTSIDGKKPFKYQVEGIIAEEESNGVILLADDMGLGKTIQALLFLKLHPEYLPALFVCKSIAKVNVFREALRWSQLISQVIETSNNIWFNQAFPITICSYDLLAQHVLVKPGQKVRDDVLERIASLNSIIVDECHYIKSNTAKRTIAIKTVTQRKKMLNEQALLRGKMTDSEIKSIKGRIAISGTYIKNHGAEAFSVWNFLMPSMFNSYEKFIREDVDSFQQGSIWKVGALKDPKYFYGTKVKGHYIRRTMNEVLPDLPPIVRKPLYVNIEEVEVSKKNDIVMNANEEVINFDGMEYVDFLQKAKKMYDAELKEFIKWYYQSENESAFEKGQNLLTRLNKLRHITGIAKVPHTVEFVKDFIESIDRKILIFVHHKRAAELIKHLLNIYMKQTNREKVFTLGSQDAARNGQKIIDEFRESKSRVIVLSTLAAGESLNMQFACDAILHERQWNPANEEQAERRMKRADTDKSIKSISVGYTLALGTIDEYFTDLIERKRELCSNSYGDEGTVAWNEASLMSELADKLVVEGRKRFNLD